MVVNTSPLKSPSLIERRLKAKGSWQTWILVIFRFCIFHVFFVIWFKIRTFTFSFCWGISICIYIYNKFFKESQKKIFCKFIIFTQIVNFQKFLIEWYKNPEKNHVSTSISPLMEIKEGVLSMISMIFLRIFNTLLFLFLICK